MNGLQLKKALLVSALAVLRCPLEAAAKDEILSNAIELLSNDEYDELEGNYPAIGVKPYDKAVSDYFAGNSTPIQ